MCMYNCPTNNIFIEDGTVYGICSRCGVCADKYPECRIDGFELEKDKQITLIKSLQILNPPLDNLKSKKKMKKSMKKGPERVGAGIQPLGFCPASRSQPDGGTDRVS